MLRILRCNVVMNANSNRACIYDTRSIVGTPRDRLRIGVHLGAVIVSFRWIHAGRTFAKGRGTRPRAHLPYSRFNKFLISRTMKNFYRIIMEILLNPRKVGSFSRTSEVSCVATEGVRKGKGGSRNLETLELLAISRYRYTIVTSFVELCPPAGNHKLKFQKESLIFHFRVPRDAEYRAEKARLRFPRIISEYRYLRSFSSARILWRAATEGHIH